MHDLASYAVPGLTFSRLVGLVWLSNLRLPPAQDSDESETKD